MKKRFFTVMLSVILAATLLAGCGKDVETSGTAGTKETKNKKSEDAKSEPKKLTLLTRIVNVNSDGTTEIAYNAKYDSLGNMTEEYIGDGFDYNFVEEKSDVGDILKMFSSPCWMEFNESGNIIKIAYGSAVSDINDINNIGNDLTKWWNVEYGADGKIIKVTQPDGDMRYEREYDSNGNLIKQKYYPNEKCLSSYEYEYDSAGNMTKKMFYQSGDLVQEYEYDSFGNTTNAIHYDRNRADVEYIERHNEYEYEYDSEGNETKIIWNDYWTMGNGEILDYHSNEFKYEYEYEFDSAGNKIKEIRYRVFSDYVSIEIEYAWEYDSSGNMVKETQYDYSGRAIDEHVWEYDLAGNLTKEIYEQMDTPERNYECEYEYITITPATN